MALMYFVRFSRSTRFGERRRQGTPSPVSEPRRPAMGIAVQPVHGHHCICPRCQRQSPTR